MVSIPTYIFFFVCNAICLTRNSFNTKKYFDPSISCLAIFTVFPFSKIFNHFSNFIGLIFLRFSCKFHYFPFNISSIFSIVEGLIRVGSRRLFDISSSVCFGLKMLSLREQPFLAQGRLITCLRIFTLSFPKPTHTHIDLIIFPIERDSLSSLETFLKPPLFFLLAINFMIFRFFKLY